MNSITSYEEWLALPDVDRQLQKRNWDAYEREGIGFAFIAGARLALSSEIKILDVHVGTYHGGEYVIHAIVSDGDFLKAPASLATSFEGFRVIYLKR